MYKILIIEDDGLFSKSAEEILRLSDYEVLVAADGRNGVKKAIELIPDLILCDIQLPDLDGFGVLKAIRNSDRLRKTLFIFMSGIPQHQDFRRAMDSGADDFLLKPFTGTELLMSVSSRLQRLEQLSESDSPLLDDDNLPINFQDRLAVRYPLTHFKKNAQVFHSGQNIHFLIFLVEGILRCSRFDHSGKELTVAIYSPGQFVGLTEWLQGLQFQDDGHALTDLVFISVPVADFKFEILRARGVSTLLTRQLATELRNQNELLLNLAYQDLRGKVAYAFLRLHGVMQNQMDPKQSLPITRVILATIAGIAKESAVRTVLDFIEEGLLEETSEGFRILDRAGLEKISQ
jgi:DNA-binding response OmpR family regulator